MSDRIKGYKWLPWAIAVVIVIAVAIVGSSYTNWYILEPWSPAASLITEMSIDAFSAGQDFNTFIQDAESYWDFRLSVLAVIVLTFVIGPSLWIYAEIKNEHTESEDVLKKGLAWYVGVILVISSLQVVPTTVIKGMVFQNIWNRAAQSENKDQLKSDLMKMGYQALEIYHLPTDKGGGDGSFQKMDRDDFRSLELSDLKNEVQLSGNSYVLETVHPDSLLKIHAIGDKEGSNTDFENADGNEGKVELTLNVKPPADFEFVESNVR